MGYNEVKIMKNERISVMKDKGGYDHPIKITLENKESKLTVLKNPIRIKKIDVDVLTFELRKT